VRQNDEQEICLEVKRMTNTANAPGGGRRKLSDTLATA
jgi:hypothetical protein